MSRCIVCGRHGLFLKVNYQQKCAECVAKIEAEEKAKEIAKQARIKSIVNRMHNISPHMIIDEECLVVDYVLNLIDKNYPEYKPTIDATTGYNKISLSAGNGFDYAFMRTHWGGDHWISINAQGLTKEQKNETPFSSAVEKKNFYKFIIDNWEDVKKYEKYILIAAKYIWDTYEIEDFRKRIEGQKDSPISLYADGPVGIGIKIDLDKLITNDVHKEN